MSTIQSAKSFGKVAVAMGGHAAERDISLLSGEAVLSALKSQGVDAIKFDTAASDIMELKEKGIDRVFNIMHGRGGEDGQLQGALELIGIPYTGSGVLGSALGMDKLRTKNCWLGAGLPTPKWMVLEKESDIDACVVALGFPVMVKPALEGSSLGMAKANTIEQLREAYKKAMKFTCDVMAEQWVEGAEYTVAVLADKALPVIRLETPNEFYDYEAKYQAETTQYHCPCGLTAEQEQALQHLSIKAFKLLAAEGWGRVDLMLDAQGKPQLLEINTVPGMTDHSLVPMAAKQAGIDFNTLVWQILETSFAKEGA
ncbi:D-alanine--D-alanine ligase [Cycloclasticus pugetii]|uniref:D-alanine--D-alanine ligase n=1 Tax=Cycloclasticus pugetii TaxID=34068 RepID=UPI0003718231|nr:D-alanine--D-alanine ligase [Cycloclasticus pugetii]